VQRLACRLRRTLASAEAEAVRERADRRPEDHCDVCDEDLRMTDIDLVLFLCGRELWVQERCTEPSGRYPKCGQVWTQDEQPSARPDLLTQPLN
jgi:hypothetical protein